MSERHLGIKASQPTGSDRGELTVRVAGAGGYEPVENAKVRISLSGRPDQIIEELRTDVSGLTETIDLSAPPVEYSMEPGQNQPYTLYDATVLADGYEPFVVEGIQLLPERDATQTVRLNPLAGGERIPEDVVIPEHTLYGDYPPKIPEAQIKPVDENGEIILSRVVIPEYVVVHDGVPDDSSAPDYYVKYADYIKNVASSEVYATWPEAALYANILCIMSVTLNRVYTEWYRSKGYDFTITSSTAYDQKWIYGRNTYTNINTLVDSVFNNYLSRPGVRQPIFTSFCDGQRVDCSGLKQWGSKYLADQGYSAIRIIRNYYGSDMYINSAEAISGVPSSWPGYDLSIGARGQKVRQLQEQLNRISQSYPAIPKVNVDGVYGNQTAAAVSAFQKVFGLPQTGVADFATWYAVSNVYTGVTRIAEPFR
ncbi:MAG: peptidoglycan-binding protein [Lachnospiraceae bacterium]|nr:peptidoglycan-binding protein [Lachnospiraceae bacterium]